MEQGGIPAIDASPGQGMKRKLAPWLPVAILLALSMALAGPFNRPAIADTDLHPGIIGKDDRQPASGNGPPWTAIGQVNIGGYRTRAICTGTLVAPRVVLTAAHCVINPGKKVPFQNKAIHFVAGVYRDTSLGSATAQCVRFPPGFHYAGPPRLLPDLPFQPATLANFKRDLAVIVLAKEIAGVTPIEPTRGNAIEPGMRFTHASYPADRRYILSRQDGCRVIGMTTDVVATDCDTHAGGSGGPLLLEQSGKLRVTAVLTGTVQRKASIFVALSNWPDMPLDGTCP